MIDIGSIHDLKEGMPFLVRVKGREIAVIRWRGEVFAVRNVCPHQLESFAAGHVRQELIAGEHPGEVDVNPDEPVLVCPLHTWPYRLRSGQCTVDPRLRVRTYAITVRGDRVLLGTTTR